MTEKNKTQNKILIAGTKSTCRKISQLHIKKCILIPFPLLDTTLLKQVKFSTDKYDWLIFTSPSAVKHFNALQNKPTFIKIAAIGPSTRKIAEDLNLNVDFSPTEYNALIFGEELSKMVKQNEKVLFPCSEIADNSLEDVFAKIQISLERVNLYSLTKLPKPQLPDFDSIAFLSGSSAAAMKEYFGSDVIEGKKIAAIGNKAAMRVKELFGLQPLVPLKSTAEETIKKLL